MRFELFKRITTTVFNNRNKVNTLEENYPGNVLTFLYEDQLINEQLMLLDFLIDEFYTNLFSPGLRDWTFWLLYEWKPGYKISENGKEYIINSLEDYFQYMSEVQDWEDE